LIGRLRCISQSKRSKQVLLGRRFNMADGSVQPIFSFKGPVPILYRKMLFYKYVYSKTSGIIKRNSKNIKILKTMILFSVNRPGISATYFGCDVTCTQRSWHGNLSIVITDRSVNTSRLMSTLTLNIVLC